MLCACFVSLTCVDIIMKLILKKMHKLVYLSILFKRLQKQVKAPIKPK